MRKRIHAFVAALAVLPFTGCDSLVEVVNPDVVEASAVDPESDQTTFAQSALQNWYAVYPSMILYQAWFTNEARVGDTFPTRNEFGKRLLADNNGTYNNDLYSPLSVAIATTADVIDLLQGLGDAGTNINLLRANFGAGWARLFMAETLCFGAMRQSPPMQTAELLDSARVAFQRAISIGDANGSDAAVAFANSARVGLARTLLMAGDDAGAISAAQSVPDGFEFYVNYIDDSGNRGRLGNDIFAFSAGGGREALVVGPEWRAIADAGDERVSYEDAERFAQDGVLRLYSQTKYEGYDADILLGSKLEADYIEAEASGLAAQTALISERRTANGLGVFASADPNAVLAELMEQKARDFWLNGTRMGDWRRNGDAVPYILEPGNNYYKVEAGLEVGSQTCWDLAADEKNFNPNFPD